MTDAVLLCPRSVVWDVLPDSCEGEGECTGESVAGQFSIFGAVEENARRGFKG